MKSLINENVCSLKEKLINGEISSEELVRECLDNIEKTNDTINSFISIDRENAIKSAKESDKKLSSGKDIGLLEGIPVAIKDNISVKDMRLTCGSKILSDYVSPYNATIVERLKSEGAIIVGKTNTDEFAMGSSTKTSHYGTTKNPLDINRVPGGSSGGSAASVASRQVPISIGSSTGGSVRHPASYCGVVGFKPTYGIISRYGLVPYAHSLDHVGILTKEVKDLGHILNTLVGSDDKDSTSVKTKNIDYTQIFNIDDKFIKGITIGVPKEYFHNKVDSRISDKVLGAIKELEKLGANIKEVSLPHTEYAPQAYKIISNVEGSSNLSRYDGVRYGNRSKNYNSVDEMIANTRSENLGSEVKRRILLGTYFASMNNQKEYYERATKLRNLISNEIYNIFKEVDVLIAPTTKQLPPLINDKEDKIIDSYKSDILTIPANLAGIPAISVPCGCIEGLSIGIQIMADKFNEETLLKVAYLYEVGRNQLGI